VLFDVETDNTNVFVTGGGSARLFLAKYSMDGNNLWNLTRSMGNISYGMETGSKLSLMEDGIIITSGVSMNYTDSTLEYFLAAFNQDGVYQWSQVFQNYPSICCDSNFIYLIQNDRLQKRDTSGAILWEQDWTGNRPTYVLSDLLYTTQVQGTPPTTSLDVETWNLTTSEKLWSSNFRLCDESHQAYNRTGIEFKVTQDGSMLILMGAVEESGWYLFHVHQNGELASIVNRINMTMTYNTQLESDNEGLVYLAGVSSTGNLTIEIYDSNHFVPITSTASEDTSYFQLSDSQIITTVAIGVVLFDIALILFLKKRV